MTSLADMRLELREKYERLKTKSRSRIGTIEEFERCNEIKDKEERLTCKFKGLHEISKVQDRMNLDIMRDLGDATDPRWLPIHIMDDANAIILEICLAEGNPKVTGYINEKVRSLNQKWFRFLHESSNPNGEKLKEDIDSFKREISAMACEELCKLVDELRITRNAIGISAPLKHFLFTGYIHYGTMELKKRCRPEYQRIIERYRGKYRKEIEEQEMLRRIGAYR